MEIQPEKEEEDANARSVVDPKGIAYVNNLETQDSKTTGDVKARSKINTIDSKHAEKKNILHINEDHGFLNVKGNDSGEETQNSDSIVGKKGANAKNNNDLKEEKEEDEEDDFGDFEEEESVSNKDDEGFGDFQDTGNEKSDVPDCTKIGIDLKFKEDYDPESPRIKGLMRKMIGIQDEDINETEGRHNATDNENHPGILLSERCQTLYDRLTQQPLNLQQINWKKSFIRRQLLLNLQIPINLDETAPSKEESFDSFRGIDLNPKDRESMEKILGHQIIPFDNLQITSEQLNEVLDKTESQIEKFYGVLQPASYYKAISEQDPDKLEKEFQTLVETKVKLLRMVSCWDKRVSEAQKDYDLFSEYVENLVGNTQKLRRQRLAGKLK